MEEYGKNARLIKHNLASLLRLQFFFFLSFINLISVNPLLCFFFLSLFLFQPFLNSPIECICLWIRGMRNLRRLQLTHFLLYMLPFSVKIVRFCWIWWHQNNLYDRYLFYMIMHRKYQQLLLNNIGKICILNRLIDREC